MQVNGKILNDVLFGVAMMHQPIMFNSNAAGHGVEILTRSALRIQNQKLGLRSKHHPSQGRAVRTHDHFGTLKQAHLVAHAHGFRSDSRKAIPAQRLDDRIFIGNSAPSGARTREIDSQIRLHEFCKSQSPRDPTANLAIVVFRQVSVASSRQVRGQNESIGSDPFLARHIFDVHRRRKHECQRLALEAA